MAEVEKDTVEFTTSEELVSKFFAPEPEPVRVEFGSLSHPGKVRERNEDHFAVVQRHRTRRVLMTNLPEGLLPPSEQNAYALIVADGMGGEVFGQFASMMALRAGWELAGTEIKWPLHINEDEVAELMQKLELYPLLIQRALTERADQNAELEGMGTTLTCAYTVGPDAFLLHVGVPGPRRPHSATRPSAFYDSMASPMSPQLYGETLYRIDLLLANSVSSTNELPSPHDLGDWHAVATILRWRCFNFLSTMTAMGHRTRTFASLFSGCGGFDLGFVQAGYRCVGAYEIDTEAISVYERNVSRSVFKCDLSSKIPRPTSINPDVVLAGPPCQGFSTAGKRNLGDPRNALLVTAAHQAIRFKPQVIVIENVAGVIAGDHRRYWDAMIQYLRSHRFRVAELLCDATLLGVPQMRKRMLAIAWRTPFGGRIDLPIHTGGTLRNAIGSINSINGAPNHDPKPLDPNSDAGQIAGHIRPGQKLCNVRASPRAVHTWTIPSVYGRTSKWERTVLKALLRRRRQQRIRDFGDADPVSAQALRFAVGKPVAETLHVLIAKGYVRRVDRRYDLVHTFNGKFRRLLWDQPAPTVDTKFGDPTTSSTPKRIARSRYERLHASKVFQIPSRSTEFRVRSIG